MRRALRGFAAFVLAAGAAALVAPSALAAQDPDDQVTVRVEIPADREFTVDDAQLRWGLNDEASSGAHAFGCNFLSAGKAGDAGGSRPWESDDDLYRASAGDVTIEKVSARGAYERATWSTRCLDRNGKAVTSSPLSPTTESQVVIDAGEGVVDQTEGSATIRWRGSFTVVMYGGLTYWTATDPVLKVVDGAGTLTATGSGYASDRENTSTWAPVKPRTITLATFERLDLGVAGFTVAPDYLGVAAGVDQPARTAANAEYWGSFPRDFVTFQGLTGQSSYWYTSGGERDRFKVALPLTVSYDADAPVTPSPTTPPTDRPTPAPAPAPAPTPAPTAPADDPRPSPTPTPSQATPVVGTPTGGGPATGQPVPPVPNPGGGAFPAVAAATVMATTPLIPAATQAVGWLAAQDPLLLGGLVVVAVSAAVGAVGLRRGWLVVPWK